MHDIWSILADEIRKYETDIAGLKVTPAVSAEEIRRHLTTSFDFRATFSTGFDQARRRNAQAVERSKYLSEEAHDSFAKIAHHAGIGRQALRRVTTDADLRLDPTDLARRVKEDRDAGKRPFLVVGTAGTTGAGVIDPLAQIGEFCRKEDLWFHVDAAWGGGALLSPALRGHLEGISGSDSVTWDAHKWLSVPMGAGMFFCKDREAVGRTFNVETGYVPDNVSGTVDLYKASLQWSRRFIGLKVFMTLAELGSDGIAAIIDHQAAMGDELRARLRERDWQVVNDSPLPLVCFTHPAIRARKISAGEVVARMLSFEDVWLSKVRLRNEDVLRACVTSYMTQASDVQALVEQAERATRLTDMDRVGMSL